MIRWCLSDTRCLRELVRAGIGRSIPRRAREIVIDTRAAFGPVTRRRIERALRWLVAHGDILRTPDGYLLFRRIA